MNRLHDMLSVLKKKLHKVIKYNPDYTEYRQSSTIIIKKSDCSGAWNRELKKRHLTLEALISMRKGLFWICEKKNQQGVDAK